MSLIEALAGNDKQSEVYYDEASKIWGKTFPISVVETKAKSEELAPSLNAKFDGVEYKGRPYLMLGYHGLDSAFGGGRQYDKLLGLAISKLDNRENDSKSNLATIYKGLAINYALKNDYDEVIKYYKRAIDVDKEVFGEDGIKIAKDYFNLGNLSYSIIAYLLGVNHIVTMP